MKRVDKDVDRMVDVGTYVARRAVLQSADHRPAEESREGGEGEELASRAANLVRMPTVVLEQRVALRHSGEAWERVVTCRLSLPMERASLHRLPRSNA